MCEGAPLSAFLKDALAYLDNLRLLSEAKDRGELHDPDAIEREISRAESAVRHVLHLVAHP